MVFYFLVAHPVVNAWELETLEVNRSKTELEIKADLLIQAPADLVFQAMTDFDNLDQLSSSIRKSERLTDVDGLQVFSRRRSCFFLLCFTSEVVEAVTYPEPGVIVSTIVPDKSDFKSGVMQWRITGTENGSRMRYHATMVPDFWIPRVVGSGAIKRTMKKQLKMIAETLETRAKETQ
ncbi:MAG: SRPBCC family protein [Pseudomonadota bacterium]